MLVQAQSEVFRAKMDFIGAQARLMEANERLRVVTETLGELAHNLVEDEE